MILDFAHIALVVLAEAHNPSILHPAFLQGEGIVPSEWELAEDPICTSAFSIVKFQNGITFTVEESKFLVLDNRPPTEPSKSIMPSIVQRYIETLKYVNYTAVGVNASAILADPEPSKSLIKKFLREGPWDDKDDRLKSVELTFLYQIQKLNASRRLTLRAGELRRLSVQNPVRGFFIEGNYHFDIPSSKDSVNDCLSAISRFPECLLDYAEITSKLFN